MIKNKYKKTVLLLSLIILIFGVFLFYNFDISTLRVSILNPSASEKEDEGTLTAAPILEKGDTSSWFKFTADPGDTWKGKIVVINQKKQTTMGGLIYAVDVNRDAGGFSPQSRDHPKVDAAWVKVETPEITLKPKEEKLIPFTINIPKSAMPGEHAIAIIIEPKAAEEISKASSGNVQLVSVQTRMGIRVYITVNGEIITAANIGEPSFVEENPLILKVPVTNTGNSILKPSIKVAIFDKDNKKIDDITNDSSYEIFPGGTLNMEAKWKNQKVGDYKAKLLISYADKTETRELTFNVKPPPKIKRSTAPKPTAVESDADKLPASESPDVQEPAPPQIPLAESSMSAGGLITLNLTTLLIIIGLLLLIAILITFIAIQYFKRKQISSTFTQQPPPPPSTPAPPPLLPKP